MKKLISIVSSVFCFAAGLSAFTWSGLVDNTTKLSTSDFAKVGLYQTNGIYLSMNANLNKTGSLRFSTEGLYKYTLNADSSKADFTNIADLDLLKVAGNWNLSSGALDLSAGRFSYSDMSGVVFSQSSDGMNISYDSLKYKAAFYAGYTGLLNSLNVSMVDKGSVTSNTQFYNLCANYIPLAADFSYKALFGSNTLGLQALYLINPDKTLTDKLYGTVSLSGPISNKGSYSVNVIAGTSAFENFMLYSNMDLTFYMAASGYVSAGAEYASGNQGGLSSFKTVTARTICNAGGGMETSGVLIPKLSGVIVYDSLFVSLTEKFVCTIPDTTFTFQGFDTSASLVFNVLSDVQTGCDINAYVDLVNSSANYFAVSLKASLSF